MADERKDGGVAGEPMKVTKDASECPVDTVTVFCDRAEVTRRVRLDFEAAGDYEVVVEGLPSCIDGDSVRVNGTGHVVLREVSYEVHHKPVVAVVPTDDTANSPEVLQQTLDTLEHDIAALGTRAQEIQRSKELLAAYADVMLKAKPKADDPAAMQGNMEFAFALLERQQAKTHELNVALAEVQDSTAAKEKLVQVTRSRLQAIGAARHNTRTKTSHDVTVVVQANQAGAVELKLVYMVSNASWSPAYDARITSTDTTLALSYYGMVRQTTGESWSNTKLVLSTATPSIGGTAPVLPTKHVGFHNPHAYQRQQLRSSSNHRHMRRGGDRSFARPEMMNMQAAAFDMPLAAAAPPPPAQVATSTVDSSGAATTFHVQRRTTIASDNKPHKVTVAILNLASAFRHYAVPALNAVAYLQCLTTNNSDYTLLASNQVNVFLDNSFVSKTEIVTVAPGEKFRTFLGVDKAVKVEYRTLSNVHRERGYFSKTEDTVYKFMCTVKNAKSMPVRMVVADMLPVSDDTSIKVKLVQPTKEEVEAGTAAEAKSKDNAAGGGAGGAGAGDGDMVAQVKLTNNLVWSRNVAPGATIEIPFEYAVEHPGGRNVQTYNVHQGR